MNNSLMLRRGSICRPPQQDTEAVCTNWWAPGDIHVFVKNSWTDFFKPLALPLNGIEKIEIRVEPLEMRKRGKMKALSIRQPWASLIAAGIKPIENRPWYTNYRGDILICAALAKPNATALKEAGATCTQFGQVMPSQFPTGYALAIASLTGMIWMEGDEHYTNHPTLREIPDSWAAWYDPASFGWILENIRPIQPFPVKGKLGLFEVHYVLDRQP